MLGHAAHDVASHVGGGVVIRIRGNAATLADIRGLLAVTTDPELRTLLEACLRMRGVA